MNKGKRLAGLLLGVLLLSACGGGAPSAPPAYDLEGARIGGPFTLTDQDGHQVRWADFDGQYRLVYFGYTFCPDVCPLDLIEITQGLRQFEKSDPAKARRIQPIFITVDPQRDTPAVLKRYVAALHPRLIGLTGTPEEIERVKKAFAVVSSKEGDPAATKDYLVSHSRTPFLFDPEGKPIALVPVNDGSGAPNAAGREGVHAFLEKWVQ